MDYHALTPDIIDLGRYRGGDGSSRAWNLVHHNARAAVCVERTKSPPFGVCGGEAGARASIALKLADGSIRPLLTKGGFNAPAGSQILLEVPGAGGYGDARERDSQACARDLQDGYVSAEPD